MKSVPPGLPTSKRLYRTLLRLYPPGFRNECGSEALEMFEDLYRATYARSGRWGLAGLWLRTLPNLLRNGPVERWTERARRTRSVGTATPWWAVGSGSTWWTDVRFAGRSLRRAPAFTFAAVSTLALGLGACIALFSLVDAIVVRSLPFPEADRLVSVWEEHAETGRHREGPSPWNFADWEREAETFSALTAWYLTSGTLRYGEIAEETRSAQVTTDFFRVFGVTPALGRDFRRDEGVAYGPLMLGHRIWERVFDGDPEIVGQIVELSGTPYEVVGVMPASFQFPDPGVEYWVAWDLPTVYATRPEARTWRFLNAVGRLSADASANEAEADLNRLQRGLADAYPEANRGWTVSLSDLHGDVVGGIDNTLWAGFGAVGALLLLACANVANLLLARAPSRAREFSVRSALGAGRSRLTQQLIIENLCIAAVATVLGLALAVGVLELIGWIEAGRIPRIDEVTIDGRVLGFAGLLMLLTSVGFGLAPVLHLVGGGSNTLRLAGAARSVSGEGVRRGLVSAQVALTFVVLTGAALFLTSLDRLASVDLGVTPEQTLAFRVSLDAGAGPPEQAWQYYDGLVNQLTDLPGVRVVGAGQTLPMDPVAGDFTRPFRNVGDGVESAEAPSAGIRIITPGYLEATGMRLLQGTDLDGREEANGPRVAIINRALAATLWPDADPVGQAFELDFRGGWLPYRVLGVVADVRHGGPRDAADLEIFLPHRQSPYLAMSVVMRTSADPRSLIPEVRRTVLAHPPGQPPHHFTTLTELFRGVTGAERLLAAMLMTFATFALTLSVSGVYGLVAYAVSSRTREYGIRLALGDDAGRLVRSIGMGAAKMAAWGLCIGIVGVLVIGRYVQSLLFDVRAWEPSILGVVSGGLLLVTVLAALASARSIVSLQPSSALRAE